MTSSRSSAAFVLIWSLQLAGLHVAKKSRSWGSRFEVKNITTGSSTAYRGKPLIFQGKIPYEFIRMSDPRSESKSPLPVPKTQSAFHPHAHRASLCERMKNWRRL
jgi:hypothetical protein